MTKKKTNNKKSKVTLELDDFINEKPKLIMADLKDLSRVYKDKDEYTPLLDELTNDEQLELDVVLELILIKEAQTRAKVTLIEQKLKNMKRH